MLFNLRLDYHTIANHTLARLTRNDVCLMFDITSQRMTFELNFYPGLYTSTIIKRTENKKMVRVVHNFFPYTKGGEY